MDRVIQGLGALVALMAALGVDGIALRVVLGIAAALLIFSPPIRRRFWPLPLPAFRSWAYQLAAQAKAMAHQRDTTNSEFDAWCSDVSRGLDDALGPGHAAEWLDRSAQRCADAGLGNRPRGGMSMPFHYAEELIEFVAKTGPTHLRDGFRPRDLPGP